MTKYRKRSDQILLFEGMKNVMSLSGVRKKNGRGIKDEDLSRMDDFAFCIHDGKFVWVGPRRALTKRSRDEIEDKLRTKAEEKPSGKRDRKKFKWIKHNLSGKYVYPSFVECHTHLIFSGHRTGEFEMRKKGATYQDISARGGGIWSTLRSVRESSPKELLSLSRQRVKRFIGQGVTTLEVKTGYGQSFESELKCLKVLRQLSREFDFGPKIIPTFLGLHVSSENKQKYVDSVLNDMLPHFRKWCSRVDAFVEDGFFSVEDLKALFKLAGDLDYDLTVHAEQLSRKGSVLAAIKAGARSCDHLVHVNLDDIRHLSRSNTVAVLLPAADYYLKIPYPPARRMLDEGVQVALATDFNPGTSPTQDLAFVGLLSRHEMSMTLAEVWSAYTYNAAAALGVEEQTAGIDEALDADFIVSSADWTEFFYQVGHTPIEEVWSRGRKIYDGVEGLLQK